MAEKKKLTKSQTVAEIAERTGLSKKDVSNVFAGLFDLAKRELSKKGPEQFVIPDVVKLVVRNQKAQKGKQFRNPQTGEVMVRDVPASRKLRARPLKKIKDLVK